MSKRAEKKFNFGQFYGKYGIALIFVVIFIAAALFVPGFMGTYNLKSILLAIACTTVLGFGATFIIILGHINIAYGSEIAFIGCIVCMVDVAAGSVWAAIAVALVIGVVLGAVTGFIITKFSIPAFMITLALTEAARGSAVLVTKGNTISGISSGFTFMDQGYVGPIPMAVRNGWSAGWQRNRHHPEMDYLHRFVAGFHGSGLRVPAEGNHRVLERVHHTLQEVRH